MIAHLLAIAAAVTVAASPGVTSIEAAPPAQVRVVAGSVSVEECIDYWCHPVGWLEVGDVRPIRMIAQVDGQWRILVAEGWLTCDLPADRGNYQVVSRNIVIAECADYATS